MVAIFFILEEILILLEIHHVILGRNDTHCLDAFQIILSFFLSKMKLTLPLLNIHRTFAEKLRRPDFSSFSEIIISDYGCSLVVEHLAYMSEPLGLIPGTSNKRK